jgi:cell division control protein 24
MLVSMGLLVDSTNDQMDPNSVPGGKRSQKEHIISELVDTERTYVQHLELLQAFKKLVEEKGIVTGDIVHDIFLNLNSILDFQRRFLIRVEQINAQPPEVQNWGRLFVQTKEQFAVYEPYIANQKRCEEVVTREFDKLRETGGPPEIQQIVESSTILSSFLLKPFQRLTKYPLLLNELQKKGDLDEERKADIMEGIEAASSVLANSNAAVAQEERQEAIEDLKGRVEDWKGHRIERFGSLLLHGTFTVLKGEGVSSSKDSEREVSHLVHLTEVITGS